MNEGCVPTLVQGPLLQKKGRSAVVTLRIRIKKDLWLALRFLLLTPASNYHRLSARTKSSKDASRVRLRPLRPTERLLVSGC